MQDFPSLEKTSLKSQPLERLHELWMNLSLLIAIRSALLKKIEFLRQQQIIRHSLEAHVSFYVDVKKIGEWTAFVRLLDAMNSSIEQFFVEFLIVSQIQILQSSVNLELCELDGLWVQVKKASGEKCLRCWQWHLDLQENLCQRCFEIVKK